MERFLPKKYHGGVAGRPLSPKIDRRQVPPLPAVHQPWPNAEADNGIGPVGWVGRVQVMLEAQLERQLVEHWRRLAGESPGDLALAYLQRAAQWEFLGATLFEADLIAAPGRKDAPTPVFLAVQVRGWFS